MLIIFFSLVGRMSDDMMDLELGEHSDLGLDIMDSDEHPEFDIVAYAKRMRGQLSDEEEKEVEAIIKKKKCGISKDNERSHEESVTQTNVSTASISQSVGSVINVNTDSTSHTKDNVASPYTESDATTEEEEKEEESEELVDFERCKSRCLSVLNRAFRSAKGNRKEALKRSIEGIINQQTPAEVEKEIDQEIERLERSIRDLQQQRMERVEKCKHFWTLQMKSLPRSGKVTARIRTGKLGGRRFVPVFLFFLFYLNIRKAPIHK